MKEPVVFLKATKKFLRDWAAQMDAGELMTRYADIERILEKLKEDITDEYGKETLLYDKLEEAYNIMEVELLARAVAGGKGRAKGDDDE